MCGSLSAPGAVQVARCQDATEGPQPEGDELTASAPFVRLHEAVSELVGSDPDAGVLEFWAAAHGIASLMICRPDLGWDDDLGHAEHMFTALCRGWVGR